MKQFLLLVDGPMGAGKSTVADLVQQKMKGTALIGLDRVKFFVSGFIRNKRNNARAYRITEVMAAEYLKLGLNVIVEQGFYLKDVLFYEKLARRNRATLLLVERTAPREKLLERISKRRKERISRGIKPKLKPIAPTRLMRNLRWADTKERASFVRVLDTTTATPQELAAGILKKIRSKAALRLLYVN